MTDRCNRCHQSPRDTKLVTLLGTDGNPTTEQWCWGCVALHGPKAPVDKETLERWALQAEFVAAGAYQPGDGGYANLDRIERARRDADRAYDRGVRVDPLDDETFR